MENNAFLNADTAWTFPVIQYAVNTSYVEVRRASGIAFILLELIRSAENHEEKLVATLYNFGVPYDIHYIFGDELANMINLEIIRMKSGRDFSTDLLNHYHVSDFEVTELGNRLFADGTIPTGNKGTKKLILYYDLAVKDIMIRCNYRLFRLENTIMETSYIGGAVLNEDDIKLFVADNMSRYGFRKGETITEYSFEEEPVSLVYKLEDAVNVRIDREGLHVTAKDKARDIYLHDNYSADIVANMLMAKKKYKFPEKLADVVRSYEELDLTRAVGIDIPSMLSKVMEKKNRLSLSPYAKMKNSECIINRETAEMLFRQCGLDGYACYYENGQLYQIRPGCFAVEANGFRGKCRINLIVTEHIPDEISDQILHSLYSYMTTDVSREENCDLLNAITDVTGSDYYLGSFVFTTLERAVKIDEKLSVLQSMDEKLKSLKAWSDISATAAAPLFDKLCQEVTADNFAVMDHHSSVLRKLLKMDEADYLNAISENLKKTGDDMIVYEVLEEAGYRTESILTIVNAFKIFCTDLLEGTAVSSRTKLGVQCTLLGQSLSELKDITSIENAAEDPAELEFDTERFLKVFATFETSLKKIGKYKVYAREQFDKLSLFESRFLELKELTIIEQEVSKDPTRIDKAYIEQMLRKSRYKDAICDLHVRLQYELNRLFNTKKEKTYDLLTDRLITGYLSADEIDEMQKLRKCRNEFQHPTERRKIKYSEQIIKNWCGIVEKLGGIDHESRGNN